MNCIYILYDQICKTLLTYDVVAIQLQFSLQRNSAKEPQKQLIIMMVLTMLTLTMLVRFTFNSCNIGTSALPDMYA